MNVSQEEIFKILKSMRKIAVVGLSPKPGRPSHDVTEYMIESGYEVSGVRPAQTEILGRPVYPRLSEVPGPLEIVDVFRAPEHVPELVEEVLPLRPKVLWLQLGITHPEAESKAEAAGIQVVSNRCILVEHRKL